MPTTITEWCEHWKSLDIIYRTSENSPLHHDNRCNLCLGTVPVTAYGIPMKGY